MFQKCAELYSMHFHHQFHLTVVPLDIVNWSYSAKLLEHF